MLSPTPTTQQVEENLAQQVAAAVDKLPDDVVRCTKVFGTYYRCNWWTASPVGGYDSPWMKGGQLGTDHRVRKSQFLCAIRSDDGLVIHVVAEIQ